MAQRSTKDGAESRAQGAKCKAQGVMDPEFFFVVSD